MLPCRRHRSSHVGEAVYRRELLASARPNDAGGAETCRTEVGLGLFPQYPHAHDPSIDAMPTGSA